ncbi:MAG: lytic transglycosylase domain-containing protein [Treponema sp.]|nr:lytic transglycosylase domain-containing protein [Treponema sp.]
MGSRKIIIPVFFGCLGSLVVCALLSARLTDHFRGESAAVALELGNETSRGMRQTQFFAQAKAGRRDIIQELYREEESRDRVVGFFMEVCASREIAEVILANASLYNIPPALAFALAWEESRFNPLAVNAKNRDGSIDRGLFQLNNRTFPRLDLPSFFNPEINAKYGMSHLQHCLEIGGTEVSALAIYNAGAGRVRGSGAPKVSLDYASRILENRWLIEDRFREREDWYQEHMANLADAKSDRPRFVPLMPLAGK